MKCILCFVVFNRPFMMKTNAVVLLEFSWQKMCVSFILAQARCEFAVDIV